MFDSRKLSADRSAFWPRRKCGTETVTLSAMVEITAPIERVWAILTDFAAYPRWNPFLTRVEGLVRCGTQLEMTVAAGDRPPMVIKPWLLTADPGRHLAWVGGVVAPGLLDGEHHIRLEDGRNGGTVLRQEDQFSGVIAPMVCDGLVDVVQAGWEAMNAAIRTRAETQ